MRHTPGDECDHCMFWDGVVNGKVMCRVPDINLCLKFKDKLEEDEEVS